MNEVRTKAGRNDPCPCGSGKKYKSCCGVMVQAESPAELSLSEISALIALLDQDRPGEAEQKSRVLLATYPASGILWKVMSVAQLRQGKDALPALRRTAELMARDGEAHKNLGAALLERGQWAEALVSLGRALAIGPDDTEALLGAATALKTLGRARESVPLYQHALQRRPRLIEAHNDLGNAFLELGQIDDAAACYRRALGIEPDNAQVHGNLGNALRQLGRLDEALVTTRRAIALNPGLSVAHNNLGLCLVALGQREEGVASYRQALQLDPRYVDALNNLGNTLSDLGEYREGLALFRQAVELDPRRPESQCGLGNALMQLGRIDESTLSFRRALALNPGYALAHLSLAAVLRQLRCPTEAEASCRAALAIEPDNIEALCLLGELRADRGQFAEAQEFFNRAIAIKPNFAVAYCGIAASRKMTRDDTAWLEGARAVLAKPLSLGHEISLHYALGKYFDDVGQYVRAFSNYRQANELSKRVESSHSTAKLSQRVDEVIGSFDAEFMREKGAATSDSEVPVFIIGMPRSGTTLAEQILASHPLVFGGGELPFWDTAFAAYQKAELESGGGAQLLPAMARDYLARVTAASGRTLRVVDKMPANFLYAGLIHAAFPNARIIHMQRHPIDTCLSIYCQNFSAMGAYANDLENLASYYTEYLRVTEHWRAVMPATTLLQIRYEELIEDLEGSARRMLNFIRLPWDPKCLDFRHTDRIVSTASKWQVRQEINFASAGRWRNYERYLGPLQRLMPPSTDGPSARG